MSNESWRPCPFSHSVVYTPKLDFTSALSTFRTGDRLKFIGERYSSYDSSTMYTFHSDSGAQVHWCLSDDEEAIIWVDLFEVMP
jgi:hypothetical protein